MFERKASISVFLLLLIVCAIHAAYFYPQMPETMASHFGLFGKPDGWASKADVLLGYPLVAGLCAFLFLGNLVVMRYIPDSLVNLPNKAYWLAPERKQETNAFISAQMLWFGSATLVLLILIVHQVFLVNLRRAAGLTYILPCLALYFVFIILLSIRFLAHFRNASKPH